MCDLDVEGPSCQTLTWRRARKHHKCCACGEQVRPGDRYHVYSGIWDGQPETYKHCARCWSLLEVLSGEVDGPVQLDLNCGQRWQDAFDEDQPDDVAALAFLTRDEAQRQLAEADHG